MKSRNIAYLPEVDHLRAFAALLIVFYHGLHLLRSRLLHDQPFEFSHWISTGNVALATIAEGHTAVALFMVLSGFIFTWGAWGHRVSYGAFVVNRVLRIYPLVLVLGFVGAAASHHRFNLGGFLHTLSPLSDLPGGLSLGPFSMLFWTIAVEFQFYLVFPFLFAIAQDRGPRVLAGMIALAVILRALALALDIGASPRDLVYAHIAGRIDQFLLGMLAAIGLRVRAPSPARCRLLAVASLAGAMAMLYAFHLAGGWPADAAWKIVWPTIEGSVWALFIAGYVGGRAPWPGVVSRALARVGEVSFSIYLLHFAIIFAMARHRLIFESGLSPTADALLNTLVLALPATLALAALSYAVIERPFLEMRRRYLFPAEPRGG